MKFLPFIFFFISYLELANILQLVYIISQYVFMLSLHIYVSINNIFLVFNS